MLSPCDCGGKARHYYNHYHEDIKDGESTIICDSCGFYIKAPTKSDVYGIWNKSRVSAVLEEIDREVEERMVKYHKKGMECKVNGSIKDSEKYSAYALEAASMLQFIRKFKEERT